MAEPVKQYRVNPYVHISMETFADPRLSFTAAGVLATILADPGKHLMGRFSTEDIMRGLDAEGVEDAVDDLVTLGYLVGL